MAALLIKNLPDELHERLRRRAAANHRSMNREVIAILEREMVPWTVEELPPPVKSLKPIRGEELVQLIRDARDGKR